MPLPMVARGLVFIACSALVFGCAHRRRRATERPTAMESSSESGVRVDEVVKWDTELTEDMPGLVPAFVNRAQHYGCDIHKNDPDAAVATCDGVRIAMAKSNRLVSIGCKGVSLEECRALFRRVVETNAPGGAPPDPAEPPPSAPPPGTGGTSI